MFAIKINNKNIIDIEKYFNKNNIEIRPFFYPYYYHEHLKSIIYEYDDIEISNNLNKNIIMLPSYPTLAIDEQIYITNVLKRFLDI
jgi:dTDP-4-amino-4,6-dideoxygalactose transaminase